MSLSFQIFRSLLHIKVVPYQGKFIVSDYWASVQHTFLSCILGGERHLHWGVGFFFPLGFLLFSGMGSDLWATDWLLRRSGLSDWGLKEKLTSLCSLFFCSFFGSQPVPGCAHSFLSLHAVSSKCEDSALAGGSVVSPNSQGLGWVSLVIQRWIPPSLETYKTGTNISQIKNKGDLKTYISLILMTLYIGAECRQVRE